MRRLVTLAAAALTLSALSIATPALADHNDDARDGYNNQYQRNDDDGYRRDRGRDAGERFDFDRHENKLDRWERGWGNQGYNQYRHQRPLSYWQLTNRLKAQGYYGVRNLRRSAHGFGWRAFAFTGRGRPVMLHINPYNGRVLNVRYV